MGLDENAGFFLIGFAEAFARFDGFGDKGFQIGGVGDAAAIGALAAEIGKGARLGGGFSWIEAVEGFGEHEREGVFPGTLGAGEDEGVGKALGADGLAEMGHGLGVAEEIAKGHALSVENERVGEQAKT